MLTRFFTRFTQPPPRLKLASLLAPAFRQAICESFCAQDELAIAHTLAPYLPIEAGVTVAFKAGAVRHRMSCLWSVTSQGHSHFTFPVPQAGQALEVVVQRWLSLFDLFIAVAEENGVSGSAAISFNDQTAEPGFAFCGNSREHILLPDADFFRTRGYQEAREHFSQHQPAWEERSARVFWRGSSVGQKQHAILEMPRARLCLLAKAMGDDWGDIGLAELFHISEADGNELRSRELLKEKVQWKTLSDYRYHVDIDGHASSFSGLFRKLLSGGLVLKVQSPHNCRQWYYDQLIPGVNFVPVRSDLSDLVEIVSYYRENPLEAKSIAQRGRDLAVAREAVKRAFKDSDAAVH